jgi:hypothetical protein
MRVHVEHFCGDYYVVKYERAWYLPEKTWGEADVNWNSPLLMARNKLKLFEYADAKALALSLTPGADC